MSLLKDHQTNIDPIQLQRVILGTTGDSAADMARHRRRHASTGIIKERRSVGGAPRIIGKIKNLQQEKIPLPFPEKGIPTSVNHAPEAGAVSTSQPRPVQTTRQPIARREPATRGYSKEQILAEYKTEIDQEIAHYRQSQMQGVDDEKKKRVEEGYQIGIKQGEGKALEEIKTHVQELTKNINDAVANKNHILQEASTELIDLSIKIAEKIVHYEISLDQDLCVKFISEALIKITDKDHVIIRANKTDLEFLKQNRDFFETEFKDIKHLEFQEDPHIDAGGYIIDTKLGYVDA
ncbi:MAG: flagellar biosynthesis/type III secretory pathway protein FliH [Candidatus Marinamargulisbacteria bacterium]|jgi:flagellar biosynthesis/type III secretory pathway protein FliH